MTQERKQIVLVTGGGGFLGKALVRRLVRRGDEVRSFSRGYYPELAALGAVHIRGDISDEKAVESACKGADIVFHTAAKAGVWGDYDAYYRTNVVGTERVIAGCRKNNVGRLIHTSSASVIYSGKDMTGGNESLPYPGRYMTAYPKTKAMAERLTVKAAGPDLKTLVLRPHLIWGPGDNHLVPRIIGRSKKLFIVGNGKNVADTIYIDNAVDAHLLAAEKLLEKPELSGKIYFISQGELVPVWQMINRILGAAGLAPVKRRIPAKLAWSAGAAMELIYRACRIKKEPYLTRFVARELSTSHWYDITAAGRDLGYAPRITVEEGLRRLEESFNKQRAEDRGGCSLEPDGLSVK